MKKYFVYIIQSQEGFRYTGMTEDLDKRIFDTTIKFYLWTKRGTNWKVIYHEKFDLKSDASKREKWLKVELVGNT